VIGLGRYIHLPRSWIATGIGLGVIAVFVVLFMVSLSTSTYDTWGAFFIAPILFILSLPALSRQAKREDDPRLFGLLIIALLVKFGGALLRNYVSFQVYGGVADAGVYHTAGAHLAIAFHHGDFATGLPTLTGTNFVVFLTGLIYTVTGVTKLGGYLVFAWIGFWGLYFFYRAFTIAVPEGRNRSYAHLVFFLPSLVYWSSGIGKDAWMVFTLGLAAYGCARILTGTTWRGLAVLGLGLWLGGMVRIHVVGMVGVGLAVAYLFRKPSPEWRQVAPLMKAMTMVIVSVLAVFLVIKTSDFLTKGNGDPLSALTKVAARTDKGGSDFTAPVLNTPQRAPIAVFTVLFRPLIIEAHNSQALVAAIEATFLLLLSFKRLPWIIAAFGSVRRQSYIALCIAYTAVFILGFSAIANFGILARERVQLLPFALVLLCIPPAPKERGDDVMKVESVRERDLGVAPGHPAISARSSLES